MENNDDSNIARAERKSEQRIMASETGDRQCRKKEITIFHLFIIMQIE